MVDADIAGHPRPHCKLALDDAMRGHREILRKERFPYLAVAIGSTCAASKRAVLLAAAEVVWRHETAFPEAQASIPRFGLVVEQAALGGGLEIHRITLLDQLLVQAYRLTLDGAESEVTLPRRLIGAEIVATDRPSADQFCQLIARIDSAAPGIGSLIDAYLIELWRVDSCEPVGDIAKLDGVAISDHGVRRPSGAAPEGKKHK